MLNFRNLLKRFILTFFITLGIFYLINLFMKPIWGEKTDAMLWALLWLALISNTAGVLIFKEGVGYKSLWIRRAFVIIINIAAILLIFMAQGLVRLENFWLFILILIPSMLIIAPAAYFIADRIEKKKLAKINKRLDEYRDK